MLNKKTKYVAIAVVILTLLLSFFCITISPYFIFAILFFGLAGLLNSIDIEYRFYLSAIFILVGLSTILLMQIVTIQLDIVKFHYNEYSFLISFLFASVILVFPFIFIYSTFSDLIEAIINQKEFNNIINNSPALVCTDHYTKTTEYTIFGYKGVRCRISKECLAHSKIIVSARIIGLIGKQSDGFVKENDFYITLWDHRQRKIRFGDYDVIEIHENNEIRDYDFVISKVITFFYNDIYRYKPINQVIVKFSGKVNISDNTKNLMQNHFHSVEFSA